MIAAGSTVGFELKFAIGAGASGDTLVIDIVDPQTFNVTAAMGV